MTSGSAAGTEGLGTQTNPRSLRNEVLGNLKEMLGGQAAVNTDPKPLTTEPTQPAGQMQIQRGVIV
jgi:hypothetical protein